MAQTKAIDIINKALALRGVKTAGVDLTPEEINNGIESLNDMMTALDAQGVRLGYSIVSDKDDVITSPDWAFGMMKYNLALLVGDEYGATTTQSLASFAAEFLLVVRNRTISISQPSLSSTLPIGAGYDQGCGQRDRIFFPDEDANNLEFANGQNMQDDTGEQLLTEGHDESF